MGDYLATGKGDYQRECEHESTKCRECAVTGCRGCELSGLIGRTVVVRSEPFISDGKGEERLTGSIEDNSAAFVLEAEA